MEPGEQPQPIAVPGAQKKSRKPLIVAGGAILGLFVLFWLVSALKPGPDLHINTKSSCSQIAPTYIGLSESDASKKAGKEGRRFRVVEQDGKFLNVTQDADSSRLGFTVAKHIIRGAGCG